MLKNNLSACGIDAPVVQRDVLLAPPTAHEPPFDLVFLDPPYAYDPTHVLEMTAALPLADAIIVYEHDVKSADAVAAAAEATSFTVKTAKKYGKTGVTILKGEA